MGREKPDEDLDITPEMVVAGYMEGLFPMAPSRRSRRVEWFRPERRAVLPLDRFHCPRTLRQRVKQEPFAIRHDTAFRAVIEACATPRPSSPGTWINDRIIEVYTTLHHAGIAHSVEAWRADTLVGGLYGIALGGAFFGESMFHRPEAGGTDASKVCLVHLVRHLRGRGFLLLDAQVSSPHMEQFGAVEVSHEAYTRWLESALAMEQRW